LKPGAIPRGKIGGANSSGRKGRRKTPKGNRKKTVSTQKSLAPTGLKQNTAKKPMQQKRSFIEKPGY